MRAIEIDSRTDRKGMLNLSYRLNRADSRVRVILLVDEPDEKEEEEQLWLKAASGNPAFDFLHHKDEDIYTLKDGEPLE